MNFARPWGFRQRSLHSPRRRLRNWMAGRIGVRPPRNHGVYVVDLGPLRVKRVVLADSAHVRRVASCLDEFANEGIYPRVLAARERELWLHWVDGEPLRESSPEVAAKLAALLSVLHRHRPRKVRTDHTAFASSLYSDLRFLNEVGVLSVREHRSLIDNAHRITPPAVWVGFDCTDAISKNFLALPSRDLCCVDAECLEANQLLGVGPAKACIRWLAPEREEFLSCLREKGGPDFLSYFGFVELSFLAAWQKTLYLERKQQFIDPGLFARFRCDP